MTAVEFILNLDLGLDEQGKEFKVKDALSVHKIKQAQEMEKEQIKKERVEAYNNGYANGQNDAYAI